MFVEVAVYRNLRYITHRHIQKHAPFVLQKVWYAPDYGRPERVVQQNQRYAFQPYKGPRVAVHCTRRPSTRHDNRADHFEARPAKPSFAVLSNISEAHNTGAATAVSVVTTSRNAARKYLAG